ncbi:leucine rich repeat-containing protein [Cardiosporidium cionae]|uniref:Leucine rich repeat-containing protein n=1 Tax=Cardiosporidium cionae TaxID=476202 RepID=A0ABQ7J8G9_9APIC|nr:leucine rich repeat-containing protein [Cardiosporidium cionae]|eukprot:KAF8820272.1 leucine rich repeat-containing protein [Cardiosporidium cionae]
MAGGTMEHKDSDSKPKPIVHLTLAKIASSESAPQNDISLLKILALPNHRISSCDELSSLKSLQRIDLPSNELTEADFLQYNLELCWIDLRMNQIHQLSFLKHLHALTVLNLSHNQVCSGVKLTSISKIDNLSGLTNLKALILSHNRIRSIPDLSFLPQLETLDFLESDKKSCKHSHLRLNFSLLVVSNNQVEEIIPCQKTMKQLKKVSLSNNQIKNFPFGEKFPGLLELRLNSNKLMSLPTLKMQQMSMLQILDIGNNAIKNIKMFLSLKNLLKLRNLNIAGNLSVEETATVFSQFSEHRTLEIFNSKNIKNASHSRKRKRKTSLSARVSKKN